MVLEFGHKFGEFLIARKKHPKEIYFTKKFHYIRYQLRCFDKKKNYIAVFSQTRGRGQDEIRGKLL